MPVLAGSYSLPVPCRATGPEPWCHWVGDGVPSVSGSRFNGGMTTAQHLAAIDLLRGQAFPAQRDRSELGDSGPGYHLAELRTEADGTHAACLPADAAVESYEAECEALAFALSTRWGEGQRFSLWSASVRSIEGEGIPQPWDQLSQCVDDVQIWRAEGHWIAVAVARAEGEGAYRLIAVVTDVDPP